MRLTAADGSEAFPLHHPGSSWVLVDQIRVEIKVTSVGRSFDDKGDRVRRRDFSLNQLLN